MKLKLPNLAGLNWYALGAKLILAAAVGLGIHFHAKHQCELEHEKQKTEQVEKKLEKTVEFTKEQLPIVQEQETVSTDRKIDVAKAKDKYDEALKTRNVPVPTCDISDAEFVQFNELAEQTRH